MWKPDAATAQAVYCSYAYPAGGDMVVGVYEPPFTVSDL